MQAVGLISEIRESVPFKAIVLHKLGDQFLATQHEMIEAGDGGSPMLSAGQLLTYETVRDLNSRLSGLTAARSVLPGSVLVADSDLLVWHQKSVARPIFFSTRNPDFNLELNGKTVLYPPLLFVARSRSLAIYALGSDERPDATTPLFRAPCYNIWASGQMCTGSIPLPKTLVASDDCLLKFETAFYDSSFVHTNLGSSKLVNWTGGHPAFWKAMSKATTRMFPYDALISLTENKKPLTVERVINETNQNRVLIDP